MVDISTENTAISVSLKKFKAMLRTPFLVLILFTACISVVKGQDIHFSQFYHAPTLLNPALTGISQADIRFSGMYRSQWNSANAPFETYFFSAENRFYNVTHPSWWFSGGFNAYYDQSGAGNLSNTNISISGSFTRMLDPENFLTIGLAAGLGQRGIDYGLLTFDNQWNGDVFDPARPTNENFDDDNYLYPDFSAGLNWRGQKTGTRSKIDAGIGFFHFNRPNQTFYKDDRSRLPMRLSLYFNPNVQVAESLDLIGFGTAQLQGKYLEGLAGFAGRYYLNTKRSRQVALQFGLEYRFNSFGDAVIPVAELHYHYMILGVSWDVNVSGFSVATNKKGGPEIAFKYFIHRVYPLKAFACPLI